MHIFMPARTQTTESQHKNMCSHTSPHQGSICTRFGSMVAIWARVAVYGRDNGTRFAWSGKSHLLSCWCLRPLPWLHERNVMLVFDGMLRGLML